MADEGVLATRQACRHFTGQWGLDEAGEENATVHSGEDSAASAVIDGIRWDSFALQLRSAYDAVLCGRDPRDGIVEEGGRHVGSRGEGDGCEGGTGCPACRKPLTCR